MTGSAVINLITLAQVDDDYFSPGWSIVGLMVVVCLVLYAMLKSEKHSSEAAEREITQLHRKISDLEKRNAKPLSSESAPLRFQEPFRIIHVDDEELVLIMVDKIIRAEFPHVRIEQFQNGDDALAELSRREPDLLITDLSNDNLPGTQKTGRSGFELLSSLVDKHVKFPILVLSGTLSREGREQHLISSLGSALNLVCLEKPFNPRNLRDVVSKFVNKSNHASYPSNGNSTNLPEALKFQIGGFHGPSHRVEYIKDGRIQYQKADNAYAWSIPSVIIPNPAEWENFWAALESIDVWAWNALYENSRIIDGTHWHLDLTMRGRTLRAEGHNAYPLPEGLNDLENGNFGRFLNALRKLTGKEIR